MSQQEEKVGRWVRLQARSFPHPMSAQIPGTSSSQSWTVCCWRERPFLYLESLHLTPDHLLTCNISIMWGEDTDLHCARGPATVVSGALQVILMHQILRNHWCGTEWLQVTLEIAVSAQQLSSSQRVQTGSEEQKERGMALSLKKRSTD